MAKRTVNPKKKQDSILTVVQKGFAEVGKRLDRHDHRFDVIDQRFDGVDERLASMDQRFDHFETVVQEGFERVEVRLRDHDARFTRIEKTLETLVQAVDHLIKIYSDLTQEVVVLRQHVRDLEERVGKVERTLKAA